MIAAHMKGNAPEGAVRVLTGDLKAARDAFGDLGSRIDHIFVSPDVKVTACGVDDSNRGGWYPSDHMPKFAVLEL